MISRKRKSNKLYAILIMFALVAMTTFSAVPIQAGEEHVLQVGDGNGEPGETVSLTVTLNEKKGLAAVQYIVRFDPNQFEISSRDWNYTEWLNASTIFNDVGYISIASAAGDFFEESGALDLVTINFLVKTGAVNGTYPITLTDLLGTGEGYVDVGLGTPVHGSITVTGGISTDAGVTSVVVDDVTAVVDETDPTVYKVELPAGTVLADLVATDVVVTPVAGAVVGTPAPSDGGATWTVEVTAEDGVTSETYTINVVVLTLDKTLLEEAIAAAQAALVGVAESDDGSDLLAGTEWATPDAIGDLEDAIGGAQDALDKAETQDEIDEAVAALNAAIEAFNTAKGTTQLPDNAIQGLTPARNATAKTSIETDQYTANVEWSPALASGGKFAASTAYTATITIVPKDGYTLNGVPANYFSVQGAESAANDADSGVVKAVFPKTAATPSSSSPGGGGAVAPTVTGIEIKAAPDKVSYDEGDKLDLTGLEVTVTYSDGKTKDIAAEDFAKNGITVSPKAGEVLDADVTAIEIKADGKTVKQVIVVDKKDIVTPQDIDKPVEKPVLTDIDGHWAEDYIDYLVGIGAISGYPDGTFRPDAPITRAEFAKVIVDAFELKGSGKVFDDTADHWAKNYVAIAAANGIVLGYNENEFGPDDLITREQMAIIIVKAAGLKEQTGVLDFIDEGNVSSWAYNWVVSAVDNNLMSGYEDNSFKPLNNATRAEAATVIYNILMK